MAVKASVKDSSGEVRSLYIRLNNFDALSNHGVPAEARFRGYASKKAFEDGAAFTWETVVPFVPDLSETGGPIWKQAYDALSAYDFTAARKLETGGQMAASFFADGEIARLQESLAANERLAEQNRQFDEGGKAKVNAQVDATLDAIRAAIDARKADKQRLEDEIAKGLEEVAELEGLSAAFGKAKAA